MDEYYHPLSVGDKNALSNKYLNNHDDWQDDHFQVLAFQTKFEGVFDNLYCCHE